MLIKFTALLYPRPLTPSPPTIPPVTLVMDQPLPAWQPPKSSLSSLCSSFHLPNSVLLVYAGFYGCVQGFHGCHLFLGPWVLRISWFGFTGLCWVLWVCPRFLVLSLVFRSVLGFMGLFCCFTYVRRTHVYHCSVT